MGTKYIFFAGRKYVFIFHDVPRRASHISDSVITRKWVRFRGGSRILQRGGGALATGVCVWGGGGSMYFTPSMVRHRPTALSENF